LVKGDFLLFFVFWGTILLQEQEKQKDNKVPIEGKSAWLKSNVTTRTLRTGFGFKTSPNSQTVMHYFCFYHTM